MIRFDSSISLAVQMSICTPMNRILSPEPVSSNPTKLSGSLYIGSLSAVNEKDLLAENGITHLVQVLDVPWLPQSEKDGFNCYRIDILDKSSVDLLPHLEDACAHIDECLRNGKNVLVHCQQGISRSAAIVIAYLIRSRRMSYESAYELVKHERPCIDPNSGFVDALKDWERQWHRPGMGRRFTS